MNGYDVRLARLAAAHLPAGAELVWIDKPYPHAAVCAADLNGDRQPEIAAAYRANGENRLLVLHYRNGAWTEACQARGLGYGVSLFGALPVTRAGRPNLTVGWQLEGGYTKPSVYEWSQGGLRDAAPPDLFCNHMEAADMPGFRGTDGKAELALWTHVAGGAYRVDVVGWTNGAFAPARESYAHYYPGVARYHEALTRQDPGNAFYWYYLAEAHCRAGHPEPALASVRRALGCALPPSREEMLNLERGLLAMLEPDADSRAAGLYPASVKTVGGLRWGYIDGAGNMTVPPRFDDANDFQPNGLAVVAERGKYGVIDASANYVVKPVYDSVSDFSEGRATVIDADGFKLIDERGRVLTKRAYPFIAGMRDGRAMFYVTPEGNEGGASRYGYLDAQGAEIIPAQFAEAYDFEGGKALAKIADNEYALIDKDGKRLATYAYPYVGPPGDGLLAFRKEANGKYGYLDERGAIVIQPAYTSALPFRNGRAIVNTAEDFKDSYGIIDKQGRFIVQAGYNDIRDLGQDRFALGMAIDPEQPFIGSRYAIADRGGKRLTDFLYRDVGEFKNGLASAEDASETYFIDRSGKPAPGYPRVAGSGTLTMEPGGLIKAYVDSRLSYLRRDGRIAWKQNTVIPLRPPYAVKELKFMPNRDYLVYYPQVEGMADSAAERSVNEKLKTMSQVKPVPADEQLGYTYSGDFEVAFYKQQLLELELTGYNFPFGAAHGMPTKTYAIVDLTDGRMFALKDLFKPGSDYVKVLSDIVGKQIKEDPQYSYVFPDAYKGIAPDQPFYVTANALHPYFAPYDIAPYSAGFPTFTIPFTQVGQILDTNGPFWKAFHA
ncbi:WG containing repeat-containing protein [Paenibacillus sp. UNC496MF]|uniref:WG repeat-containing protein n=1 Tax=Paenibacillus sp. UNC496MF TaxID=1502753 RepID=UPI0008E1F886|nr:WG repeat-containing protein [Paenibacillus sp. UNC496MF]SFI36130.1 WG containing repeat-containing protein [Paenibacillus sp. UNC496MF]